MKCWYEEERFKISDLVYTLRSSKKKEIKPTVNSEEELIKITVEVNSKKQVKENGGDRESSGVEDKWIEILLSEVEHENDWT